MQLITHHAMKQMHMSIGHRDFCSSRLSVLHAAAADSIYNFCMATTSEDWT